MMKNYCNEVRTVNQTLNSKLFFSTIVNIIVNCPWPLRFFPLFKHACISLVLFRTIKSLTKHVFFVTVAEGEWGRR